MSIFDFFGLAKPIDAVGNLYTTDKARIDAETRLTESENKIPLAQIENNKVSSLSSNLFNSAWQPAIGWTAGFCVFLYWVPQLVVANYIWACQCLVNHALMPFPILPDQIYNLVWLLFGFGGYSLIKRGMQR